MIPNGRSNLTIPSTTEFSINLEKDGEHESSMSGLKSLGYNSTPVSLIENSILYNHEPALEYERWLDDYPRPDNPEVRKV